MRFIKALYVMTILFLLADKAAVARAKTERADSLCTRKEDVYFNCELEDVHKFVSVCAAQNSSPDEGYVQYRYGTKSRVDFAYPATLLPPRDRISLIDVSRLAEGLGSHLKFRNGDYEFVISNALVPGEIYVAKNNKIVFDKICKGGDYIPFSNESRKGLQLGVLGVIDGHDNH